MAYRLKLQEPLAQGVRRIAFEQLDMAEEKLAGNGDASAAIHDARRCLKRLRALLRLVRPALDEAVYKREAERVARTGRLLSGARDVHVMRLTAAKLESRFGPSPTGKRLQTLLAGSSNPCMTDKDACRQASQRLKQTRKFFAGHAFDDMSFAPVVEGLERCYRKGRKGFRGAYRKPTDEAFHAWRKCVQQHWRQMQLVSRAWPEALSARANEAKELSQLLGEDHDLAVLLAHISEPGMDMPREELAALEGQCRSCQAEVRALAKPRGARLFSEPAEDLAQRIEAYWSSACLLAQTAPPEAPATVAKTPATARKRPARVKS